MPEAVAHEARAGSRRERLIWLAVLVALCLWTAWRMGAFDLSTTVQTAGGPVEVPNTYATVDHPFHATRADALLESLREGELLRWVGNHQGGYPVEFYPLGIAWLDVGLWALLLGTVPIIAVHKLAVILVFLLPAVGFWILTRGDRLHPGVAVLAMAMHVAVPGHWLNGGYSEVAGWGLVTNVAGGSLALIASAALARFVLHRERGMGLLAIVAAAAGALSNPRSLFALVIAALAILLAAAWSHADLPVRTRLREALARIGLVGGIAALIAAPVILPLVRYQAEYFFLHYQFYEPIGLYLAAMDTAVTPLVLALAVGGVLSLPWLRRLVILRAMSLTLIGYMLFTVWVAMSSWIPPLVEQLEAPRLMPFQRQLMIYVAAALVGEGIRSLGGRMPAWQGTAARATAFVVLGVAVLAAFVRPVEMIPERYRGVVAQRDIPETFQSLSPISTTGVTEFADFRDAVRAGETLRVQGTSMFVVGNRDDWWHEQLWAPTESDAPFYYDDWLWYWTTTHQGPYDYRNGHYFPNPTYALTPEYFAANGISVVLVTDMYVAQGPAPREAARANAALEYERTIGSWDVYRVRHATAIVTNGDALPTRIEIQNQRISAAFGEGDGTILIRRNWFPRWEATVDGERVEITKRDDGYMELRAEPGSAEVELRYVVTALDWGARLASVVGVAGLVALVVGGRRLEGWLEQWTRSKKVPGADAA